MNKRWIWIVCALILFALSYPSLVRLRARWELQKVIWGMETLIPARPEPYRPAGVLEDSLEETRRKIAEHPQKD